MWAVRLLFLKGNSDMEKQKAEVGKNYRTALLPELRSIDEKARTITFVASTESVDRMGDILRVSGWKLDAYKKNPIFMWNHKSGEPPIGKCVEIHTESSPPSLVQTIQFADAATYGFADTVFRLYAGRYLNAVSVGFLPLESPTPIQDLEGFTGYEFSAMELLELSACPLPANSECLARAVNKGGFSETDLQRIFSSDKEQESISETLADLRKELGELKQQLAGLAAELKSRETIKSEELCSVESLCSAIQEAGTYVREKESELVSDEPEIETIDQLGEALKDGEISTVKKLFEIVSEKS
jgi:hypothetical protein